jgi:hypothetical protein
MSADRTKASAAWDSGWEDNSIRLLKATLRATPAQRLAWLEEAIRIAYSSGALVPQKVSGTKGQDS